MVISKKLEDLYNEKLLEIESIKGMTPEKIDELKNTLDKISQIKTKEAEIIEGWNALLQEAQEKVTDVESKLTTPDES